MLRIIRRPAAKRDLTRQFVWLAENASLAVARKFLAAAKASFADLAANPKLGAVKIHAGKYAGVRLWRVTGFHQHLILYRSLDEAVAIERVIHAKQDFQRVLT